ncbi:2-oxo-4-hydroxy-4-carboxy-5-ureidoimidazoline decarboxylase [Leptolyngbya sp. CCNP1308]|uniref:2-oxo-4-hydroxy-4-carboxy-5-ureidoimidazoline decarboxylase n=1 Tax=Leptolyngbya sp. CCNP1308 TaxID=3110255 RepID=UPI002B2024F6|nr:2-oxo-4-hydroxy-4-carboxy-5-ureidoimidazoline decarboxylase [Leptolyngbya sp. CCNP1308]MEA5450889.1 2-oxo-4-hydroxy-4-carboxy-5-ureidoimidazoline decarboxylase [Leptolyngbya sp. CCNP1308]
MPYSLDQLNAMAEADFVAALGPAFEETPAIAAQVWPLRPFTSVADLHQRMVAVVRTMAPADQLALINAHPDLGTRVAMAEASVSEQSNAGLTSLTAEEYHQFQALNQQYKVKFGFPFILAVAGHTKTSILENFMGRLRNSTDVEMTTALLAIEEIALARLNSWINPD